MSRRVAEWIGKTDDTPIPDRVKERIAARVEDICARCDRKVGGKLQACFDHAIPLILGGPNRESNIQLLCDECHKAKTKLDVKLKAKVARVRKRHLGIRRPSGTLAGRGFPAAPPQRRASGSVNKWRGF